MWRDSIAPIRMSAVVGGSVTVRSPAVPACVSQPASCSRNRVGVGSGRFDSMQAARNVSEPEMTAPRYWLISMSTSVSCSRTGTPGCKPRSSSVTGVAPSGCSAISISCCFDPVR